MAMPADNLPSTTLAHSTRRKFLTTGLSLCSLPLIGTAAQANTAIIRPVKRIKLLHAHTGEKLHTTFFIEDSYVEESFEEIDFFLRDFRDEAVLEIRRDLIELVSNVHHLLDTEEPLIVNSGYRSPKTNAMLRRRSHGVARNSLHIRGMAIDFHVKGRSVRNVARAARSLKSGGVGEYQGSHFVHMDVGRVRSWYRR